MPRTARPRPPAARATTLPAVTIALLVGGRRARGLAAVLDDAVAGAHPADRCDELALDALDALDPCGALGCGEPGAVVAPRPLDRPGTDGRDPAGRAGAAPGGRPRVVLVSVRPGPAGAAPSEADRAAWHRARHRHDVAGVPLADWVVVGGGQARSSRARRGEPWR